jgi:hypothetical protein
MKKAKVAEPNNPKLAIAKSAGKNTKDDPKYAKGKKVSPKKKKA